MKQDREIGKIFFPKCVNIVEHRSGWNYAMAGLQDLHHQDGVLLDDFIENNFSWRYPGTKHNKIIPYQRPWIGFIHNPPKMPQWFGDGKSSNQKVFNRREWTQSLRYCKGLFTLSEYHKNWLKKKTSKFNFPISHLYHPTETPELKFTFDRFMENENKKVIQVGWWLRKIESIHNLMVNDDLTKIILQLTSSWFPRMKLSKTGYKIDPKVEKMSYLNNDDYDDLLSQNIVFLDLYDSSANNATIECIVRNTPILISKIPPAVEYLGEDYPFYFSSIKEASKKINDFELIKETYLYLRNYNKEYLARDYFVKSIIESEVYTKL
jgi:hypothetical protein